jgi:glycosyltransferase involved in cell wall biosynthesis
MKCRGCNLKIAILSFYGKQKRRVSSNRIYGLLRGLSKLGAKVYLFTIPVSLPPEECFDVSFCEDVVEFSCFPLPFCLYEAGRKVMQKIVYRNLSGNIPEESGEKERTDSLNLVRNLWHWRYASPIFRDDTRGKGYFVFTTLTAHKLLRYVQKNNIRVLFTSHAPPIAHEIGLYINQKMGSRLYWIADFRDPLIGYEYPLPITYSERLARIQEKTFLFADLVTMVSCSMIEDAQRFISSRSIRVESNKFFCLYNGFLKEVVELRPSDDIPFDKERLRISYTGSIHRERSLSTFFEALLSFEEERERIEFIYVGPQADLVRYMVNRYQLQSVSRILEEVSKETALWIQNVSNILLLLKGDTDRGVFTGKYFEYLSSGKPILVIGDKDKEFNEIALRVGGVKIVPNGPEGSKQIEVILRSLINTTNLQTEIRSIFGERREEEVSRFHWDSLAERFYERILRDLGNEV